MMLGYHQADAWLGHSIVQHSN